MVHIFIHVYIIFICIYIKNSTFWINLLWISCYTTRYKSIMLYKIICKYKIGDIILSISLLFYKNINFTIIYNIIYKINLISCILLYFEIYVTKFYTIFLSPSTILYLYIWCHQSGCIPQQFSLYLYRIVCLYNNLIKIIHIATFIL